MRVPQSYIQKCKVTAHVFQALLIFIAGCITLSVLTKDGTTGGPTKFYFALCFLTTPALIYLVMVPMWSRAARFANAYAFLALDALYTLFWFAAFISLAVWNAKGVDQGAQDKKLPSNAGNCSTWAYGSESRCKLSLATTDFGIIIFLFFALTTAISSYYLIKFRKEGAMPYEAKQVDAYHTSGETQKEDAWDTEIERNGGDPFDDEERHTEHGGNQEEDEYALLHSTETDEGRHPGRPLSWGDDRFEERAPHPPYAAYDEHGTGVNALSPGGYEEFRREDGQQPHANVPYGSGGQGYSFSGGDR